MMCNLDVNESIFLESKDDNYSLMKSKLVVLKELKKRIYIKSDMVAHFLRLSGYNGLISVVDVVMIFRGVKVPSQELYDDIKKILEICLSI